MRASRTYALWLFLTAGIVIAGTTALVVLQIVQLEQFAPSLLVQPILMLLLAIGVALLLVGLGALINKPQEMSVEIVQALGRVQTQTAELARKIDDLGVIVDHLRHAPQADHKPAVEAVNRAVNDLLGKLDEIHDLAMLPDAERARRFEALRQQRKTADVQGVFDLVAIRAYAQADQIIASLETEFPGDEKVLQVKHHLNHFRGLAEHEAIEEARARIDDLLSISAWDDAYERARKLAGDFPQNREAIELLERVRRERDAIGEADAKRAYDEVRSAIDRRQWREALELAERMMQRHPTHPRTARLREQHDTMRENAEIEERQELEFRMEALIKAKQWQDAITLAEDIRARYPLSPQAQVLEEMLPRLHEMLRDPSRANTVFQSRVEISGS